MAVLRVDHPDIRDFISCKVDENQITNFNISVGLTDEFMKAVKEGSTYDLVAPHTGELVETVDAREIFDLIVRYAWHNGEPGVLFLDSANRTNPVPHLYKLEATNPCGEQWLGPYENCCLGSINLSQHCAPSGRVDWEKLRQTVELSTRFLENVVAANAYVPAVPQLKEAAHQARRIGLGIMGLADLMYHVGVVYDTAEGRDLAAQIMEFIGYHAYRTSIELAEERGPFPVITDSIYDPDNMTWEPPQPIEDFTQDFDRPVVDWDTVVVGIKKHGIRNAALTTIAPTGTLATVAGCEGYGCEPVFALAYYRHVNDHGEDLKLAYLSSSFEQELIRAGFDDDVRDEIIQKVMESGSCQGVTELSSAMRNVYKVSQDISVDGHVRMQAALQAFVDNSLSKTCNFPADARETDVADAFIKAWELGCKGLTVYVTGSRHKVVLETESTAIEKFLDEPTATQLEIWQEGKKPRPQKLDGATYQISTPLGKAFVTVNHNGNGQPFEVFITTAKAGSETAAVSEALGRLSSYVLRVASPLSPRDRMAEIVRQLAGIGGGHPTGFGPNRVLSLPDGLARALAAYLGETPAILFRDEQIESESQISMQVGDLCPECGAPALVNEEGCRKCYSCGFSEC
jgi:ribonucleoside-diphosphate reductase alpha chain